MFIQGPAGRLEVICVEPKQSVIRAVLVVCHPHPLQKGTMHNKVVTTLAKAGELQGAVTVRFNFRGVGESEGVFGHAEGECDDLRAIIAWVQRSYPGLAIWLAGFSFGSYISARVANDDSIAEKLISIAPPVESTGVYYDFSTLNRVHCPWLVVQGDLDEIVSFPKVQAWALRPPSPLEFVVMPAVGHFFHRRLIELREIVMRFLCQMIY